MILPDSSSKACKLHTAKHFCAWSQLEESGVYLALADGRLTLNGDYAVFGKQSHFVETLDKTY